MSGAICGTGPRGRFARPGYDATLRILLRPPRPAVQPARHLVPHPGFDQRRPLHLAAVRSEEHTSELQSRGHLVCRLLLEKKKHTTAEALGPSLPTRL